MHKGRSNLSCLFGEHSKKKWCFFKKKKIAMDRNHRRPITGCFVHVCYAMKKKRQKKKFKLVGPHQTGKGGGKCVGRDIEATKRNAKLNGRVHL